MTTFDETHMERQLSSLFRAEAQNHNLPLGTWQAISPRMGEPDAPSLVWRLRRSMSFQQWTSPTRIKYAAPAATLLLAAITAILFVLLVNDDESGQSGPIPASSPTVETEATTTPIRFEPTVIPADEWQQFELPEGVGFNAGLTALRDGRILVFGGSLAAPGSADEWVEDPETGQLVRQKKVASPWIFDPESGETISAGSMPEADLSMTGESVLVLEDGRVMMFVGREEGLMQIQYFDPETLTWTLGGLLGVERRLIGAHETPSGDIVVYGPPAGGAGPANQETHIVEVVDGTTGEIYVTTPAPVSPHWAGFGHSAMLPDGRLLIVQENMNERAETAILDPSSGEWTAVDGPPLGFYHLTGLPDGLVLASEDEVAHVFDPVLMGWRPISPPPTFANSHPVGVIEAGNSALFGSYMIYVADQDQWMEIPQPPHGGQSIVSVVSGSGSLVSVNVSEEQRSAYVLDDPLSTAVPIDADSPPSPQATATPLATNNPVPTIPAEPVGIRTVVANARDGIMQFSPSAFDGEHLWIPEQSFVAKIDIEGNRVGSFQVARNQISSITVHDGFLWVLDRGEREVRKVTLAGETVDRYQAGDVLGVSSSNGDGIWSFSPSAGMIKHDSDWEVVEHVAIPTDPGTVGIAEDSFWLWVGSTLKQFSHTAEEIGSWSVPKQPVGEPNRTDDVQVKGGYVWLTGYSRTEITRLDPVTGETLKIGLPLYDGEYDSNGVFVTHPTALVTDDAVWVAYMRYGEPDLDPSEAGLFFGESSFRRLSVFGYDGELLREEIIVEPGEPEKSFQLLFPVPLQPIRQLNDEVWIGVGAEAGSTIFKVFDSGFLNSAQ